MNMFEILTFILLVAVFVLVYYTEFGGQIEIKRKSLKKGRLKNEK